ncbi:MAG: VacB/RNase II family 3'-5' exoribonuclease [Oscillospiraceae bacterium]|nr:VacB/RNase II family 3'-5' exoribonuclease [Oscillospiraceae bacterium]
MRNMKRNRAEKIVVALFEAGKPVSNGELAKFVGVKKATELKPALADLSRRGLITAAKGGWKPTGEGFFKAEIMRVFRAHGFVKDAKTDEEFFVPGKKLLGGVPGDFAIARVVSRARGENLSPSAEVILITEQTSNALTGSIVREGGEFYVIPSAFCAEPLFIKSYGGFKLHEGDKVGFVINSRGARHSEHIADITAVYGSGSNARVCVSAYLDEKLIPLEFSEEAKTEARKIIQKGIKSTEFETRLDLRDEIIFTIDGEDTKDIDDAISIAKTANGYRLGVHIADVSHYVKHNSDLDRDAFGRGTSVYIADMVIPMLPKELSNGICSLNPKEDRLALSCIIELSNAAEIADFKFVKTIIKSRVQGVYSEINSLLNGENNTGDKYAEVQDSLLLMQELAAKLRQNRKNRGTPFIETSESKIICDENGVCVDIQKRESGATAVSENMIEEFMLVANNCAARLAMGLEMPFVYRVHEEPTLEKIDTLKETLALIGAEYVLSGRGAADMAGIVERARGTDESGIINILILRAMMKAKYSDEPLGHFGLVMREYAHFTSPIRRYPDLTVHRIISDYILKNNKSFVKKKYGKFVRESAAKSSFAELRAISAERDCEKFYMAEFMQKHVGSEFDGVISGVLQNGNGFFVMLGNTVEGRVSGESLGVCASNNSISLIEQLSGRVYAIGDKVRVKCAAVNVSLGMIDFEVV